MPLIGFVGPMGSFKTASMTALAYLISQVFELNLYANYSSFKSANLIKSWDDIMKMEKGIFCFDEMPITMDSRQCRDNVKMTHWLVQTRKKRLFVFYTAQDPSMVDKRVRQNTDIMVWCSKSRDRATGKPAAWWTIIDWPASQNGQWRITGYKKLKDISQFFKLYDHEQTISVIEDSQSPISRRHR